MCYLFLNNLSIKNYEQMFSFFVFYILHELVQISLDLTRTLKSGILSICVTFSLCVSYRLRNTRLQKRKWVSLYICYSLIYWTDNINNCRSLNFIIYIILIHFITWESIKINVHKDTNRLSKKLIYFYIFPHMHTYTY